MLVANNWSTLTQLLQAPPSRRETSISWTEGEAANAPPTAAQAHRERDLMVGWLQRKAIIHRRPEALDVAERLHRCCDERPCMSSACPICVRRVQRIWTAAGSRFRSVLRRQKEPLVSVTIIPAGYYFTGWRGLTRATSLDEATALDHLRSELQRVLEEAKIDLAIGGIDLTLNADRRDRLVSSPQRFSTHWRPHLHLVMKKREYDQGRHVLTRAFSPHACIPRPIFKTPLDQNPGAFAYQLKRLGYRSEYTARVTYTHNNGQNTRDRILSVAQRLELILFLDQTDLHERLIMKGVKWEIRKSGGNFRENGQPAACA